MRFRLPKFKNPQAVLSDGFFFAGLGCLGYGLYTGIAPWIAYSVIGGVLMLVGVLGARR